MDYLIWSNEHHLWWKANHHGYTGAKSRAGIYSEKDAIEICTGANIGISDEGAPHECMVPTENNTKKKED